MTATCYLGLGSNLGDPVAHLTSALSALEQHPAIRLINRSPFYGSKAIGPGTQPDFINAVIEVQTTLAPAPLLHALQAIENQHGRERRLRWGARTLDIDILLYDNQTISEPDLQIPHPRLSERAFVLVPLQKIAPDLQLPNGTSVASLLDYVSTDDVWLLQFQDGV
ncbi:MAG TPA: 2-amino-4-hydroxy-6-hydroxymethyldihydropteridine diphosphokinase [Spongiibacteraceae bacterium]|nr:2-amino-4-hydroxy-6-hydroxymethyldihydropteridine diphosphokinase [Spongiibacteraceae bacterium]HCS26066.1 2-amino-4-hydroxy-6-hydroxymethyldihydropteridine diphosphokinase [Spongiibacteraceae bacterium]